MSAIALQRLIGESPADLIPCRSRRMRTDPDKPLSFADMITTVFYDAHTARLSRALENSPRNVQKWISADDAPPHAEEFLQQQMDVINSMPFDPYTDVKDTLQRALQHGLHPEAVASILSKIYEELTGKTIR